MAAEEAPPSSSSAPAEAAVAQEPPAECPFCVMMRKGGCEEAFKVEREGALPRDMHTLAR